ncbi:hypothetical protein LBMAG53_06850 [Planctomycetota bacterium]|nr:hypothetical protein LBMAG53_06850 [Planctomycetota bacterium]
MSQAGSVDAVRDGHGEPGQVLLVMCRPWLVALPVSDVVRVMAADAGNAVGSQLTIGGESWKTASLSKLLGLASTPDQAAAAFVLIRPGGRPAALATGPCLRVGALPGALVHLPPCAFRHRRPAPCFPAGALAATHGLAAFGLFIDPAKHVAGIADQ